MILTREFQKIGESYIGNTGYGDAYIRLYSKYNSQSIDNNGSNVTTELRYYLTRGTLSTGTMNGNISGSLSGNYDWGYTTFNAGETTLLSVSGNVPHNTEGKKVVEFTGTYNASFGGSGSVYGSADLPTIPRASSISATDSEIGKSSIIVINKASNNFTSTLRYSFKDLSGTIVEKTELQNYGWEIPDSFYEKMTAQNEECTIYCDTYNGNSLLGIKSTKINILVGADGLPVFDMQNTSFVDVNSDTTILTGDNQKMILNYSNGKLVGKATFRKFAKPSFVSLDVGTEIPFSVLEEADEETKISFEYAFNGFDCQNHQISVVDDRDGIVSLEIKDINSLPKYPANQTINFSTIKYVPLSIDLNAFRPDPKVSGEIRINFTGDCWNFNFGVVQNEFALNVKYRENSYEEKTWIDLKVLIKDTDYQFDESNLKISSINDISLGDIFDYTKKYDIGLFFEDKLVSSSGIRQVLRAKPIFWWNKDGVYDGDDNPLGGSIKIERWN